MAVFTKCTLFVTLLAVFVGLTPFLLSYQAGGWVRLYTHNPYNYSFASIPDMSGKVVIVTGGNTGIGKVTVRELARRGANVILAARSPAKGQAAVADILAEVGGDKTVQFMPLDLASFSSIRAFAAAFLAKALPLHVLILNAGVMMCPYAETGDGFEMQIGTNHFGHFLLVRLLQDALLVSAPARIVVVSSSAHEWAPAGGVRPETFRSDLDYSPLVAYGQSKLANILMSNALSRRLKGTGVLCNALHPGVIKTELGRHIETMEGFAAAAFRLTMAAAMQPGMFNADDGALTQLFVATYPDLSAHGRYFVPVAYDTAPTAAAQNVTLQEEFWAVSDRLTDEALARLPTEAAVPH